MPHFANKYIGRQWVAGAQGPDSFDCWGFARYILKHEYGHDVPPVNINPDNLRDVLHAFKSDKAFQSFYEVVKPRDGDVVLMRQAKNPVHAGIWLDVDGVYRTYAYSVAQGRYEVRATRLDDKDDSSRSGHELRWISAKGYVVSDKNYGNVTLLAIVMKATDNLS